jgi:hypothetical protein
MIYLVEIQSSSGKRATNEYEASSIRGHCVSSNWTSVNILGSKNSPTYACGRNWMRRQPGTSGEPNEGRRT